MTSPCGLTVSKWLPDARYKSLSEARASSFPKVEHSIVVSSELV